MHGCRKRRRIHCDILGLKDQATMVKMCLGWETGKEKREETSSEGSGKDQRAEAMLRGGIAGFWQALVTASGCAQVLRACNLNRRS